MNTHTLRSLKDQWGMILQVFSLLNNFSSSSITLFDVEHRGSKRIGWMHLLDIVLWNS